MEGDLKAGRYRIGKKIPGGGMGDVYHAHDARLDRQVAFKVIKPQYLNDLQFRERLAREARAAAAVSHPGIAQPYDYVDDGNEAFIVYEFIEGETLQKRLGERRFATEEILDVGIKIADALTAVHEKSFIHRDLKPANIMLTPRPDGPDRVRVLDFGLVKRLGLFSDKGPTAAGAASLTEPGMQPGTIDYMSPEQLRSGRVDQRSDIHALGLILYEMATGVHPYRGSDVASTIANILNHEPPPLAERNPVSPPGLDHIVRKCLRKHPEDRYQTAKELLVDLSELRPRASGPRPAPVPLAPEPPLAVSRGLARALFLLIQLGYLAMYICLAIYLPEHFDRMSIFFPSCVVAPVLLFALVGLCGVAVRLYLLSAVGFDYPDSGRLFRRVFPAILVLDLIWAAAPLLLHKEWKEVVWVMVVGLAYLPFAQRSLIYSAYGPRGGRTSGVRAATSA